MPGLCGDKGIEAFSEEQLRATENALISDELQELIGAARLVWVESDDPQGDQTLPPELQNALARLRAALDPYAAVMV